jgi:hypothetical protein
LYDFPRVGVTAGLKFGINNFSVYHNIENAACPFLQFRIDAVFLLDFRCDTRSLRMIVSFTAVLDENLHNYSPYHVPTLSYFHSRFKRTAWIPGGRHGKSLPDL